MSYGLDIWAHPIPNSFEEALRITGELRGDGDTKRANPKYVELARRLTASYPSSTDLIADTSDEVWSDGPVDGLSSGPLWGVGILTQHAYVVAPFVIEQAAALGLIVLDRQLGRVHVAGKVFTHADKKKPWWNPF
nr:hypothetical protein [uncultured Albidiferax sp.]